MLEEVKTNCILQV